MKKIFDWTVGSFFRTIGRAIAFFVMAMLVYFLLSYNDISFGIKDLFFERVKADTQESAIWQIYYNDTGKTNPLGENGNFQYFQPTMNGNTMSQKYIYFNKSIIKNENFDYITIPLTLTGREYFTSTEYVDKEIICDWTLDPVANGGFEAEAYNCRGFGTGEYSAPAPINIQIDVSLASTISQAQSPCELQNNKIKCMLLENVNFDMLILNYSISNQNSIVPIKINIGHVIGKYTSAIDRQTQAQQQTNEAITNQTQQQQQQHQETMNSSTTDAENDATSFFGNFTVEDQGGLSAIVTAPLNTIRSLLSSTCADLVLPLPFVEEDLTLPCMYSIYSQHFGAFFSLYQTIILGIIAYRCIMSIFFDIKGFTNPNDDRIEVMDL